MEGFLHCAMPKKGDKYKKWKRCYIKLDDISARLLCFKDQSQSEQKGVFFIRDCEVSNPLMEDVNDGVKVDQMLFCFVVKEQVGIYKDCVWYLAAETEKLKKQWIQAIHLVARTGPREAKFSQTGNDKDYNFESRVSEFKVSSTGHALYKVRCCCSVVSKHAASRLRREWDVWHRFSDFVSLDSKLRKELGFQIKNINLPQRQVLKGFLGRKALDAEFLEERRVGLDRYMISLCRIRTVVDFFKHHSNEHLKEFVNFDGQSSHLDDSSYYASSTGNKNTTAASRVSSPSTLANKGKKPKKKKSSATKNTTPVVASSTPVKSKKDKPVVVASAIVATSNSAKSKKDKKKKKKASASAPPPSTESSVVKVPVVTAAAAPPPPPPSSQKAPAVLPSPPKAASPASFKPPMAPQPGRNDLMAQIRLGKALKSN